MANDGGGAGLGGGHGGGHGRVRDLRSYDDAGEALARITEIYEAGVSAIRQSWQDFVEGAGAAAPEPAFYPYVGITLEAGDIQTTHRLAYGNLPAAGTYGTTVTRPDLFRSYYLEQLTLLMRNHGQPLEVGISDRPIPLTFVIEEASTDISAEAIQSLQGLFPLPDLSQIDDSIANGSYLKPAEGPKPLALFSAERIDYSLVRLSHYTATDPRFFQRYVLFTNYQRYVEEFIAYGRAQVAKGEEYRAFVEPGNVFTPNPRRSDSPASGRRPAHLPQMPAYHLLGDRHEGLTLVNIGIGPSNAKTITDHLAVLRPHCWLMIGHCGGLRQTQRLGDYVLAHAYVRGDHVLDADLPDWVPVPPIAEVQIALTQAIAETTRLAGSELKLRLRTGTVYTTDDRDWELRHDEIATRFNQSRAIAIDMESATIAANGFRFRVPYGTLLCVSDKPLHGEIKLPGMANAFYRERVSQHLQIGVATLRILREAGNKYLHSRKLRSFDEPAFR
jgi:AMP nucleosidase